MKCKKLVDKYYITSNIFSYNQKLYFETDQEYIKINNSNWHKYLNDYGWVKLHLGWRQRLYKEKSIRNFKYGVLDCGANGDCMFHCIAEALNNPLSHLECQHDIKSIRSAVANEINDENFIPILESYKLETEEDDFFGEWDPFKIKNKNELKNEIKKLGNNFWGDHITLQLLQKSLKFNTIILNSEDNLSDKFTIKSTASDIMHYDYTIILYYIEGLHFQLVGYFNNDLMVTKFDKDKLPKELINIYNIDCFSNLNL